MSIEGKICDFLVGYDPAVKCGAPAAAEFTTHDFNGPPMNGARGHLCAEHFARWKRSAVSAPTVDTKQQEPKP